MKRQYTRRQFVRQTVGTSAALATTWHTPTLALGAADDQWGDLTGRLVYDGEPPEREKLKVDKDVECCGKFDIRDESLMVGEDGGLGNVYVYVRSRKVDIHPELEESVEEQVLFDNRDCIFIPHCLSIWYPKQQFHIVNSDPVAQNVAFSPLGDVPANIVIPVDGEATHEFKRKQNVPVPIACNYHPWESAHILPRENPYVAITAMDGTFSIPKLPAGKLEFQVWHERIGYLNTPEWKKGRVKLTIESGANDLGTIKIDPAWLVKK